MIDIARVRQELPALKAEEFSSQATQMIRVEENLTKSWDAAREVHSEYKRILKELKANRVQSGMINKVADKIVEPLDGAINQEFVRTDEAMRSPNLWSAQSSRAFTNGITSHVRPSWHLARRLRCRRSLTVA